MRQDNQTARGSIKTGRNAVIFKEDAVTEISEDRRSRRRYAVDLPLQYKVMNHYRVCQAGTGRTLNMSSGGTAFETNDLLKTGTFVELSITWPVLLNRSCPLKLVVTGRVVRGEAGMAAIRLERYEFRTQGSGAFQTMVNQAVAAGMHL